MNTRKITGASIAGAALLLSSVAPAAQAIQVDTTPPELVSFELDPTVVDARAGGTVTATAHITDETCLDGSDPIFAVHNAAGNSYGSLQRGALVSGDCSDGVYETSFPISATDLGLQPFGAWTVTIYPLSDTLGNSAGLGHPSFFGDRAFTYAAAPDAVGDLAVTAAHTEGLSATWSAPDANGSPITEYVVEVEDAAGTSVLTESVDQALLEDLAVSLEAGQEYSLEVTAHNAIGGTETATAAFVPQPAVTPAPVVFTDQDGTENDTYTIPEAEGVEYLIGGEVVASGAYSGSGTVEVTARATGDRVIAQGVTTTWSATFAETPYEVTPAAPTFTDEDGTDADTFTVPQIEGVEYLVEGEVVAAGVHPAAGTVEITARATENHVIAEGSTTTWTNTYAETPYEVTPGAPTFTDEDGTEDDTYTIPATAGVEYLVEGVVVEAGAYAGTGTVEVTARATDDHVIAQGATTLWKTTFSTETAPSTASPFVDITPASTFHTEMAWMAEHEISGGWDIGDGQKEYRPHVAVDRDVMAAFLYRLAGSPEFTAPETSPFTDITPESTFYKEMAWMAQAEISGGWATEAGKEYRPHVAVDRDVMAAFLYRLSGQL